MIVINDDENIEETKRLRLSEGEITVFKGTSSVVKYLRLDCNQLASFSSTGFPNLKFLDLSGNQFTSFSAEKGTFPKLKVLFFSRNQLSLFSVEEGAFPNLESLHLSNNRLTSFIAEEGAFPKLKMLCLSYNFDLEVLEVSAPNLKSLWIYRTEVQFLDKSLVGKVQDRKDVQVHYHIRETKLLVLGFQHEGHPVVEEIVAHLTR